MHGFEGLFLKSLKDAIREEGTIDLKAINEQGISKVRTDFLGSHTVVTYPPLDALGDYDGETVLNEVSFNPEIHAYVHIPFCEYPCNFCPYTTLNVKGRDAQNIATYMTALKSEIAFWSIVMQEQGSQIRSLYIGGGTPFALPAYKLRDVLKCVRSTLPFAEQFDLCVETSPMASLDEDADTKFQILREFGVNRISIGVQTFDQKTLSDMARMHPGHDEDEARAVDKLIVDSGIDNINVDMMQDLPSVTNTIERLKSDLLQIANLRPPHVTWYNMRLRPETAYARSGVRFVEEHESISTRLTIWNVMEGLGYKVLEGDRFALSEEYEDNFRKVRGSVGDDAPQLIGMGVSAYSHAGKHFWQNPRVIGDKVRADSRIATEQYIQRVGETGHAITHGMTLSPQEILAGKFVLGLKKGVNLDQLEKYFTDPSCSDYTSQLKENLDLLQNMGLIEIGEDNVVQFTRTGRLFENEVCSVFYTSEVRHRAAKRLQEKNLLPIAE